MRDSCVFYKGYDEAIRACPYEYRAKIYAIIFDYMFDDKEPECQEGFEYALFLSMRANIDNSKKRYDASIENGLKGGAPKGNQNAKKTTENNLEQPRNNLNDNDNVNVNYNDNLNNISPLSTNVDIPPTREVHIKKSAKLKSELEHNQMFSEFWNAYPNRKNKPAAVKAYGKIKPMSREVTDEILAGIERWKNSGRWKNKQYIPYPATFLNGKMWEDEVECCQKSSVSEVKKPKSEADELAEWLGKDDPRVIRLREKERKAQSSE